MITSSQLLAAGRSFMGVREAPRPFHMVTQGFLPRFAETRPDEVRANPPGAALGPLFACEPGVGDAAKGEERPTHPGALPVPVAAAGRPVTPVPEADERRVRPPKGDERRARLRHASWARLLGLGATPPVRNRGVQGELSLMTVRVKRNDLVDADLELVRVVRKERGFGPARGAGGGAPDSSPGSTEKAGKTARGVALVLAWRKWFRREASATG